MLFFDGINHPGAATVKADGLDGAMLYAGTPASRTGKDFTAAQYVDYRAHGLFTGLVYESGTNDMAGGASAGKAHAADFLADCRSKGVVFTDPACVAIDEHVAAGNLPLAVTYVRAFVAAVKAGGWKGPVGVYGFPEVLAACHAAGIVDWYWGAGRRADQPAYVNVWQDNNAHITVGGASDDKDWVLIPLPTTKPAPTPTPTTPPEDEMSFDLTTKLRTPPEVDGTGTVEEALTAVLHGIGGVRGAGAVIADFASVVDRLDKLSTAVADLTTKVDSLGTGTASAPVTSGQVAFDFTGTATPKA